MTTTSLLADGPGQTGACLDTLSREAARRGLAVLLVPDPGGGWWYLLEVRRG
jgi:hypothetical protein